MEKEKYLKIILKISSLFLLYFIPLFFLVVSDFGKNFLQVGTFLGNLLIRYPYQWDYELMFLGIYLVWGIFLWKASKNPEKNITFIKFTAWGFIVNAITMIIVGSVKTEDLIHLITDSVPWFGLGFLIFYFNKN
ncbi:hypothetical protein HY448_02515 [Candidatus Pacearchaeota archaeon]|nr:hypothetical protein [Candidatus Pacearchaeota archaeon]